MIRLILGIVLIIIAVILLVIMVQGPDNQIAASIMTPLSCKDGEKLIQVLGPLPPQYQWNRWRAKRGLLL